MSKLHFKFINGNEILKDVDVEYKFVDNKYIFEDDKQSFAFYVGDYFEFTKETSYDFFKITIGETASCTYTLKGEGVTFDIGVIEHEYIFSDKQLIFKYNIESDVEDEKNVTKTIILSFS